MIYYANPSTEQVRDAIARGELGCIATPRQGNVVFPDEWDMIADNGCFSSRWSHHEWLRWLTAQPRSYRFAVAPDVFHRDGRPCHDETLARWRRYGPTIERMGFTPAFVAQVGCTPDTLPDDAPVVFIGGTTAWKLDPHHGGAIAERAKADGRWVHMGRVNSEKRLVRAIEFGCDSSDGTYIKWGPDENLPLMLRKLARARARVEGRPALGLW